MKRVGFIFGGRSGEHEVSLMSAAEVIRAAEKADFDIVKIGIDKDGKCRKAILEIINVLHPTEEAYLLDCAHEDVEDRRPAIGNH